MSELVQANGESVNPDEVVDFGWTFWPEHVLIAIDLLLVHLGAHDKLVIPPTFARPKKPNGTLGEEILMRPALPKKSIDAAVAILWAQRSRAPGDGKLWWHLSIYEGSHWRSRLTIAGIDPDTLEVVDRRRWAFAFQQVSTGEVLRPTYSQVKQLELINSSLPTPELTPRINEFKALKKGIRNRKKKDHLLRTRAQAQQQEDYGFGQPEKQGTPEMDQYGRPFSY